LHVSPTSRQTIQFADRSYRPWRYFEGQVLASDVIEKDTEKMRVRRFRPKKAASVGRITELVTAWREAVTPWLRDKSFVLPTGVKIVEVRTAAAAAAA